MSVFNSSIGFGAYANTGFGATALAKAQADVNKYCKKDSADYDDFSCTFAQSDLKVAKGVGTESAEDALKMQVKQGLDVGLTQQEMELDPEWARKYLSKNWFERLTIEKKLALGGAVLGGILVIIFALKS
jgi:hypothetical protein